MTSRHDLSDLLRYLLVAGIALFYPYFRVRFLPAGDWLSFALLAIFVFAATLQFYRSNFVLFVPAVFFFLLFLAYPLIDFQVKFTKLAFPGVMYVVPFVLYFGLIFLSARVRSAINWLKTGTVDNLTIILMTAMIIVSGLALIGWATLPKPDLSHFFTNLPDIRPGFLILGGIGFALTNAFAEEFIFRAILTDGLQRCLQAEKITIFSQALLFGLWHYKGFPGGLVGMGLVFIWGLALGFFRFRTNGMLAPYITHVFADVSIFTILIIMKV